MLAQRLGAVYDLLGEKMGDTALAAKVIQGHLFVRSAQEWNVHVADGWYALQTAWLYRCLKTYELYLTERSTEVDFFSRGAFDKSPEATQQRKDRIKQMRERLSREATSMRSLGCADSMKGCWNLDVPFVRSVDVGSPSLSRAGRNAPVKKPTLQVKRSRQVRDNESTDAGSDSTKSSKAGWNGYVVDTWVERETGDRPMRNP